MKIKDWGAPTAAVAIGLVVLCVAVFTYEADPGIWSGLSLGDLGPLHFGKPQAAAPTAHPSRTAGGGGAGSSSKNGGNGKSVNPPAGKILISAYTGGTNPAKVIAQLNASKVKVSVVSWVFFWDAVETSPNGYNWTRLDAAVAAAGASGRKSYIRVVAGLHSPAWIYASGVPAMIVPGSCLSGGPNSFGTIKLPATWNTTYVALWTTFIKALGARYDRNSNLFAASIGGGGILGEMQLPHCPTLLKQFGYSDAALLAAWKQFELAGRFAFPNHSTSLAIEEPLGFGTSNVMPPLIAYTRASFGGRLWLQQNGLRDLTRPKGGYYQQLLSASVYTKVGWQMWSGGNTAAQLKAAFRIAIMSRASYVEVYLKDIVNPLNASSLQYLAVGSL